MAKLTKQYFTSNGSWIAPAGITEILLIGSGGGGGGAGGNNLPSNEAGAGGGGAIQSSVYVTVTPNTTYTVTVGAGGNGNAANSDGSIGANTTFGSLATFSGASGGNSFTSLGLGGASFTTNNGINIFMSNATVAGRSIANVGNGGANHIAGIAGDQNIVGGFSGGSGGTSSGS